MAQNNNQQAVVEEQGEEPEPLTGAVSQLGAIVN